MVKAVASVNAMLFGNLFFNCFIVFTFLRLLVINSGALAMYFSAPRFHFALSYYWKLSAKHLRYFLQRICSIDGHERAQTECKGVKRLCSLGRLAVMEKLLV